MNRGNRWEDLRQDRLAAPAASAGYERARRAFELGEQIRALREEQHISQAELARRMGSTQPAIAAWKPAASLRAWTPWTGRPPPSASNSSSPSTTRNNTTAASCQAEHRQEGHAMRITKRALRPWSSATHTPTCSFCGKQQHQARKLIAGPGVYICNECIDLCTQIIAEERPTT